MEYVKTTPLSEDAFCLLDLLDILMADPDALFYPYHPAFECRKIRVGAKAQAGYPRFEPDKGAGVPISSLTWNDKKLNLSILARIPGTVHLTGDFAKHGFAETYPTHVYRNYAIVKDGFLNVPLLPITFGAGTSIGPTYIGLGFIRELPSLPGCSDYLLDLTSIPIINRAIADGQTSATELCRMAWLEVGLEAKIKTYKFLLAEAQGEKKKTVFTAEQEAYLKSQGIGKDGFAPPTVKEEPTDKYTAKEFEIKIKGFSSWPKVLSVREKIDNGKNLTEAEQMIAAGLTRFERICDSLNLEPAAIITHLEQEIATFKRELFQLRSKLQRTKFAVLLAKRWFDEFTTREDCKITVDGHEFTISLREVEVKI